MLPLIADPFFYAVAVPAVLVTGVAKGGFGAGLGILAVPMMALAVLPLQAAAIMLPILCVMDIFGLHAWRGRWDRGAMRVLLPGALVGIGLGTLSAGALRPEHIRLIVGVVAVVFALNYWLGGGGMAAARPPNAAKGLLWSTVSGFTSFVAHAGGPPLSVYLLPLRLEKSLFVGTSTVFFAAVNYIKLVPYAALGQFSAENLGTALALVPLAPVGIRLGVWLNRRLPPATFYRWSYVLVFAVGLKLVWDGAGALLAAWLG
jgi:hypothetical protein